MAIPLFAAQLIVLVLAIIVMIFVSKLSQRKNILPVVFLMMLIAVLFISFWGYSAHIQNGYALHNEKYQMKNGNYAEIWIKTDNKGKAVKCSDIFIRNSQGIIVDGDNIDFSSNFAEQDIQYKNAAKYFKEKYKLNIYSSSVNDVKNSMIKIGAISFTPIAFIFSLVLIELPLFIILLIGRLRVKYKRQHEELRKLEIEIGL